MVSLCLTLVGRIIQYAVPIDGDILPVNPLPALPCNNNPRIRSESSTEAALSLSLVSVGRNVSQLTLVVGPAIHVEVERRAAILQLSIHPHAISGSRNLRRSKTLGMCILHILHAFTLIRDM